MSEWSRQFERLLVALALLSAQPAAQAGVTEYTDKDAWSAAVGAFTTVGFAGFPPGTFISEQYAGLGIHFTDGNDSIPPLDTTTFPNDGSGLDGNGDINVSFDRPQLWIAVDYPGSIQFELFLQDQLVYTSNRFLPGGIGNFAGLLSTELFDAARLIDVVGTDAEIDDLHFGVPACPADLDGDRIVAVPDLLTLLAAWGTNPSGPPDFDGDGAVAVPDLLALLASWGPCPSPPGPCVGDLDTDWNVGVADLLLLLAAWGTNPGGPVDVDGDGVVAIPDLLLLLVNWGPCP